METKRIGDREVHPIGIGTWGMGGDRFSDGNLYADYRNDEAEAAAIRYSLSKGQNHIDTAQLYGAGHTEEIVGRALKGVDRSSVFVATKVWRSHSLRHAVPKAAEESLRKLGIEVIDLLYIHAPFDAVDMGEYIGGLCDAVDRGLARSIAVSNFNLDQLRKAVGMSKHPIAANQLLYNILEHGLSTRDMLEFCRKEEITVVAYRPVERKLLADQVESPVVKRIAKHHGRPASQVAISWLISQPGVVTIPKASSRNHIDENLGALDLELSSEEMTELSALGEKG